MAASGKNTKNTIDAIIERDAKLTDELAQPGIDSTRFEKLSRELARIQPLASIAARLHAVSAERETVQPMLDDPELDSALRDLAVEERERLDAEFHSLESRLEVLLLADQEPDRNAILEVRAGTGGEEAALFARELARMYQRYAELKGWGYSVMGQSETELGGVRELVVEIVGAEAFRRLHLESGVHRVQRVPVTESGGRLHTSAATVAVLPEIEETEIVLHDHDLRIDVYRSSGPGGQSVNTTDSAVRITHIPSGLVVTQQDEKSQYRNKAKALKILRARLADYTRSRQAAERAANRRGQIGSGDRSERVRTYNFPQNRVTDHRIGLTLHQLSLVLDGEKLDEVIEPLLAAERAARLVEKQGLDSE